MAEQKGTRGIRVGLAAALLAASVLLSRVMGYAREAALAHQVGVGSDTDAFYAAFLIPDILNYFLAGGALSIAFLPLYSARLAQQDERGAEHLFATVLGTMGALVVVATGLLWWFAEPLIALQFPRFDPESRALTVRLTRIVLPAQIFFVTGGILRAVLMAHGSFSAQALAPLLYNAGIIALGLGLGGQFGVEGFAWGALLGAFIGPFAIPLGQLLGRVKLRLRVAPTDRAFLKYLVVAAPLMLGVTLLTVDEWYEKWFGQLGGEGTIAVLGYARRLMQAPVAVVGQALATAALPLLARLHAEQRHGELDAVLTGTLRAGAGLAVLAAGGLAVAARPLVELLYHRGAFTQADAEIVAALLVILALAVPAWVVQQIAVRAFYARGDTWRPMLLGSAIAAIAIPVYFLAGSRAGAAGLAWAGVAAMSANAVATLILARALHGAPSLLRILESLLRACLVALPAVALAGWIAGDALGAPAALRELALRGGAYGVAAGLLAVFLADGDTRAAFARIAGRLRLRRGASEPDSGG